MVERKAIIEYLNEIFSETVINDYSYNGLQYEGFEFVTKIASGVDAKSEFFRRAAKIKADFAIVHHGIFWKGGEWSKIDRHAKKTIKELMEANINLYAMHLPLDAHPVYGNNAIIAQELGAKIIEPFGGKSPVGFLASLETEMKIADFIDLVEKKIGKIITHLDYGEDKVKKIGIVSGGGWSSFTDPLVYDGKVDLILTGEIIHQAAAACCERELHMISAGHYNTEIYGVKKLAQHIAEKFGLEHEFIDLPTGL